MTNRNNNNQQVAVIQPPRMQMPAHVATEYGVNEDSWRALIDAVFPLAKSVGSVILALAYCKRHSLDVFQKPVHIVPMRVGNKEVETVWPGIGQIRVMAQRQPEFCGYDDMEFGPDKTQAFKGKKAKWREKQGGGWERAGFEDVEVDLTFPEWAQFVVYKMLHGQRIRLPGPKVWFLETFSGTGEGALVPNDKWARSPRQMLEKCAEAAAYRRAFPDVLGNEMSAEEMEGKDMMGHNGGAPIEADYVVVSGEEKGEATTKGPKRSDYRGDQQEQQQGGEQGQQQDQGGGGQQQQEAAEVHPLDRGGIPSNAAQWDSFITLFEERLRTFRNRQQVETEQAAQQFRIDAADFKTKQRIFTLIGEIAEPLPEAGEEPEEEEQQEATPAAEQQEGDDAKA